MSLRKKKHHDSAEVDSGPLNDILFILMFFFLIISTLANPDVIKMSNPKATSDTKAKQSVIVSLSKTGDCFVGQNKIVFDSLESNLRTYLLKEDTASKPAVVINADSLVAWKDIVKVMAIAKKLGASTSASVAK
jgi:biopolymer transport protein ExbD